MVCVEKECSGSPESALIWLELIAFTALASAVSHAVAWSPAELRAWPPRWWSGGILIGSREMPVQCADLLIAHGCDIAATHSPDAPLREWALAHQQLHIADFEEFREWGEMLGCDYLFSVVNFRILPTSLIQSPAVFAINYHDSLLAKYAGSHACAWALHNCETIHGVSWHVMTDKVDG